MTQTTNHSLVKTVGVPALLHAFNEFVTSHASGDPSRQAMIDQAVSDLLCGSPSVFASFLAKNRPALLEQSPTLLVDLYLRALANCGSDAERDYIGQLGRRHGIEALLATPDGESGNQAQPEIAFTAAQQRALAQLRGLAHLHFSRAHTWGIRTRSLGWVVGQSGSGKTHLMRHLANELDLKFVPVAIGNWIPTGARNGLPTLQLVRRLVSAPGRAMLFIDEFEKFRSNDGSTWSSSILGELLALLEYNPGGDWHPREVRRLREKVWITAAATYQDLWKSPKISVGFGKSGHQRCEAEMIQKVRTSGWIPEELLFRLSDPPAVLPPYTAEDFRLVCASLGIPDGIVDIEAAVASGMNMRAMENAVTAHALRQLQDKEVRHEY